MVEIVQAISFGCQKGHYGSCAYEAALNFDIHLNFRDIDSARFAINEYYEFTAFPEDARVVLLSMS